MNGEALWLQARFIEAAQEYNLHAGLATYKREVLELAVARGADPNGKELTALRNQIAEHDQQVTIHETTLRQFVERFPALRTHWVVLEYELEFLTP